jgi:hypothetical protein
MMNKAFYPDPFTGEPVEVEITGYINSSIGERRAYIRKAGGGLLRDKFFGFTTFVETKLVPMSEIVVAHVQSLS